MSWLEEQATGSVSTPFKDLLPPLSRDEQEALRASIELDGVREPVIVDELDQVLDGHHRLAIAPDAPIRVVSGLTDAEKRAYVYQANFARRNLSPDQKRERTKHMKAVAVALREEDPVKNTEDRIGALLGVAQQTVSDWLNMRVTGSDNAHIPTAKVKIPPPEKPIILERVEEGEKQEQVAADYGVVQSTISRIVNAERKAQEKKREREEKVAHIGDVGIQHGDFRELGATIADASVDLILTDPPYDKDSIPLYGDLAALAARVLRPGGWCLAYSGQTWLPEYLRQMSEHLIYGWTFAVHHPGANLRYRRFKLWNKWKPVLGFYKPPLDAWWDWFPDLATGSKEKAEHEWQQATAEAVHYVEALCPPGGVVLDPMAGSGTVCIAAILAERQWIGFEKVAETVDVARVRIHEAMEETLL